MLKLLKMVKSISAFYPCALILMIMLFVVVIGSSSNQTYYNKAFAATNTSSPTSSVSSIPKAKQDTFSAIGIMIC
jgi:hypothetical protein